MGNLSKEKALLHNELVASSRKPHQDHVRGPSDVAEIGPVKEKEERKRELVGKGLRP